MTVRSTLWLLAGADPTGGAGLWRDVATARACAPELALATVVTAWTRQGDGAPASAQPRSTEHLRADLEQQPRPRAIKLGLCPAAIVGDLLPLLADTGAPVVLDPVLMASDGGDLGARAGRLRDVLRDMSVQTWLLTPNRPEAAALAEADADDPDLVARLAERLRGPALLLKDGHGGDPERVCDHLWVAGVVHTFSRLRQLVLDIPTLDDRAAPQLATLTRLEQLDLGGTQISDVGLKSLAGLTQLTELKLHHTRVTNRGLANLAGLSRLRLLELDHTDLVDDGVAHLKQLRALRVLRLDWTLITDAALPHLLGMTELEQLNLADTVVTAEGVAVLRKLPTLRVVNLARTRAEAGR